MATDVGPGGSSESGRSSGCNTRTNPPAKSIRAKTTNVFSKIFNINVSLGNLFSGRVFAGRELPRVLLLAPQPEHCKPKAQGQHSVRRQAGPCGSLPRIRRDEPHIQQNIEDSDSNF